MNESSDGPADESGTATKWRTLLALPATASVFVGGEAFSSLADDFGRVFADVRLSTGHHGARPTGPFDLMLVDARADSGAVWTSEEVQGQLKPGGVFARLRSLSVMERIGLRAPRGRADTLGLLTTANQQVPVEFWNPDSHHPERPRRGYRCLVEISSGTASDALSSIRIPPEVARLVRDRVGEPAMVENVRFRRRGSVLVSLRGPAGAVILRISSAGQNRARLLRNREALRLLHGRQDLPLSVAARIPEAVAAMEIGEYAYDLETQLPGLPLWRLRPGSRVRVRAAANAVRFAQDLESGLGAGLLLDTERYESVVGGSIARVSEDLHGFLPAQQVLATLDAVLRRRFQGRPEPLVIGHGDYTPGNILVDPRSGDLLAVVDWDTFHPLEVRGVDRWHFVLLEALAACGGDVSVACGVLRRMPDLDLGLTAFAAVRMHERAMAFGREGLGARQSHAAIIEALGTISPHPWRGSESA